jgi:putative tryptophan/tyrosine transport system substrate-binding protein
MTDAAARLNCVAWQCGGVAGVALAQQGDRVRRIGVLMSSMKTIPNNVSAVYWARSFARDGGLLSYAADTGELWHRAASYVDRILRGASPAELPVQFPTKFEMIINLKTAKALGLTIPETLLATADEVIQ